MDEQTNTDVAVLDQPELDESDVETEENEYVITQKLPFSDSFYVLSVIINDFKNDIFTTKELREKIKAVDKTFVLNNIYTFLGSRVKRGAIKSLGGDRYQRIPNSVLFIEQLPRGFITINTWEILQESPEPITVKEIAVKIEEKWKVNNSFDLEGSHLNIKVASVLSNWYYMAKVLNRYGERREGFSYEIKPEIIERPVMSSRYTHRKGAS